MICIHNNEQAQMALIDRLAEALQRAQAVNDTFWDFPGFKAVALFVKNELD